ncbi:MAG: hypothetical protein JF886_04405 [Candidatus Dormibacteraeota bacterium]|uniref:Uncharacterized protein n=1 Tax=Candidatus Aeolococcus gillhamiae TaxID=3127015 RepID=A0A934MYY6_9BACT|nr:hypothetical protein [Candidatus Dormibacteraeota bacterium]
MAAQTPTDGSARAVAADAPATSPPRPEDCSHPAPVVGVMAHEFSTYQGAIGPEGTRRTSTYYGPVLGGLPISAWHCQTCGLLRLTFVDGRREERRLYPGPQPGLLAEPTPFDPQQVGYGLQARVSGVTVPPSMYTELVAPYERAPFPPLWERVELPAWNALTWTTVLGLSIVGVGLLITGILAVYTYTTPASVGPVVTATGLTFLAVLLLQLAGAAQRQWFPFPPIAPSVAATQRGTPALDGATKAVITLLSFSMLGLLAAAILAVYTYSTSAAELPVVIITVITALLAVIIGLGGSITRHMRGR